MARHQSTVVTLSATVASLCAGHAVRADLTLTPEGVARGFGISVFASGFPVSNSVGPEGIGYAPDGTVLVTTYGTGAVQRFMNIDNQSAATTTVLASYGTDGANDVRYLGASAYMSQYSQGDVVQLNPNGTINHVVAGGLSHPLGLAPNPITGRLFVGLSTGVIDLNPSNGQFTTLASGSDVDGITLSPDGSVLYAAVRNGANAQHLIGYNTSSGAIVFDSGVLSGGIDGTALGFGPFLGYIYANMNNGTVIEINLSTLSQTVIASGGSRGDFVAADPLGTGDMLVTQGDRIMRLTGIPAPSTLTVAGLLAFAAVRRRRDRSRSA